MGMQQVEEKKKIEDCAENDWLKPENGYLWTLTPYSKDAQLSYNVHYMGDIGTDGAHTSLAIYPTIYLKSSVYIINGTGKKENPFQIARIIN